jgi:hypothetical protein
MCCLHQVGGKEKTQENRFECSLTTYHLSGSVIFLGSTLLRLPLTLWVAILAQERTVTLLLSNFEAPLKPISAVLTVLTPECIFSPLGLGEVL